MNGTPYQGTKPVFKGHIFTKEYDDKNSIITKNRIPYNYFITKGTGESDITVHAGSYHLALKQSGIEICNIINYSSILPAIAKEIKKPTDLEFGSVMESIMAIANVKKGEQATSGIAYSWLHNKKTGKKLGGLVCEHSGNYSEDEIDNKLYASINELYENGFSEDYNLEKVNVIKESFIPKKEFGTALVAICFVNYIYPLANPKT
jgi:arginine decarboxylase